MKITEAKLKQIIKEEVVKLLTENEDQQENEDKENAIKILELLDHQDPWYFAQGVSFYSLFKGDIETNAPTENSQILEKLRAIDRFAYSSDIENVDFLSDLSDLNVTEEIDLNGCESLENVDGLQGLTNLKSLDLGFCNSLENVGALQGLTNLTKLNLGGCTSLQNVDVLQGLTNLTRLELAGDTFTVLQSRGALGVLKSLPNLTSLNLVGCEKLKNVDGLQGLTNLTTLDLTYCYSLQNVDGLQGLTNLTTLNLMWCTSLKNVDGLKGCTSLTYLDLVDCRSLPRKLRTRFVTDSIGTAYEKLMKV